MASRGSDLFCKALEILEGCPDQCDASCYRCLRNFRNRLDHNLLDRKLGAQVLRQVTTGVTPPYSTDRARSSVDLLAADLRRQFSDEFDIATPTGSPTQAPIVMTRRATGKATSIDLHSPVAPAVPLYATQVRQLTLVDELLVRKNLGEGNCKGCCSSLMDRLG